jgi:hypothetical protein
MAFTGPGGRLAQMTGAPMKFSMHIPLTLALLASGFGGMAQTPAAPVGKGDKTQAPQFKGAEVAAISMAAKQVKTLQLLLTTLIRGGDKSYLDSQPKANAKDPVKNAAADTQNTLISFATQGIPLDPVLKKGDMGDTIYVAKLMDRLNPRTGAFGLNHKALSSIYGDIMSFAIPLAKDKSPAITVEIQAAYDLTDPTSPAMEKYYAAEEVYLSALAARDEAIGKSIAETGGVFADTKFYTAAKNALSKFNHPNGGNAFKIQEAQEKIRKYENNNPAVFLKRRLAAWERAPLKDGVPVFSVDTYPRPENWSDEKGWTVFKYKSTELIDEDKYSKIDTDTTVKYAKGIVDAAVNAKWEKTETFKMTDDQSFTLEMSIKRVFVSWPWLDTEIFNNVNWKWNDVNKKAVVSDGKGNPDTQLPWLMDSFIIVKGVIIKTTARKDIKTFLEEKLHIKADVTVGPFTLNSEFNKHDKKDFIHNKNNEISIEIADPQIIAVVATRVPKCP